MSDELDRLSDRVEQLHTEAKASRSAIETRIIELEYQARSCEARLHTGNERFSELERRTQPQTIAKWLPWIVSLAIMIGGWVWTFARYPTAEDIERKIQRESPYIADRGRVLDAVSGYESMRGIISAIQVEMARTNAKIDQVLDRLKGKQ